MNERSFLVLCGFLALLGGLAIVSYAALALGGRDAPGELLTIASATAGILAERVASWQRAA